MIAFATAVFLLACLSSWTDCSCEIMHMSHQYCRLVSFDMDLKP